MTEILKKIADTISDKFPKDMKGSVKFVFTDQGCVVADCNGAKIGDAPADCTLRADTETFLDILNGTTDATQAFMSNQLIVEGDMGVAMELISVFS